MNASTAITSSLRFSSLRKASGAAREHHLRHGTAGFVLFPQHLDQLDHLVSLLELGEDEVLLVLLVVLLHELTYQRRGLQEEFRPHVVFVAQPPQAFLINEQRRG